MRAFREVPGPVHVWTPVTYRAAVATPWDDLGRPLTEPGRPGPGSCLFVVVVIYLWGRILWVAHAIHMARRFG